jgi:hypothetical protein
LVWCLLPLLIVPFPCSCLQEYFPLPHGFGLLPCYLFHSLPFTASSPLLLSLSFSLFPSYTCFPFQFITLCFLVDWICSVFNFSLNTFGCTTQKMSGTPKNIFYKLKTKVLIFKFIFFTWSLNNTPIKYLMGSIVFQ